MHFNQCFIGMKVRLRKHKGPAYDPITASIGFQIQTHIALILVSIYLKCHILSIIHDSTFHHLSLIFPTAQAVGD